MLQTAHKAQDSAHNSCLAHNAERHRQDPGLKWREVLRAGTLVRDPGFSLHPASQRKANQTRRLTIVPGHQQAMAHASLAEQGQVHVSTVSYNLLRLWSKVTLIS